MDFLYSSKVFGKLNLTLIMLFFIFHFGIYLIKLFRQSKQINCFLINKIILYNEYIHNLVEFIEGEVYPSLIVTVISMFFYAYGCFTFICTIFMYICFGLTYFLGYKGDHLTFKIIGRVGSVLFSVMIFLYSIIMFQSACPYT